jgi:antitoxin MazE9
MKVSVSLPGEDVQFLDAYAKEQGLESRSAALHRAVRLLRTAELGGTYEAAWDE